MKEQIKNYLGIAGIIALLAVSGSAIRYVAAYSKSIQPASFRSFTVSGEGKAVAKPDVAKFTFSVITEGGKDIGALQKQNTDASNKAIKYLKEKGIEEKDIATTGYNIEPRYQYFNCRFGGVCPPSQIVGYTVRQTVGVKIRDFEKSGDILAGVVESGANSVSELSFTIDDPTAAQNEARAKAIAKAKDKAAAIAGAGDFNVGRLISIDENTPGQPPIYGIGGAADEKALAVPNIQPGSQEITVTVNLTYEIK